MKRYVIISALVFLAVILLNAAQMTCRYCANTALRDELRAETDAWLATLPRIPDNENGALPILKGMKLFTDPPDVIFDHPDYGFNPANATHIKLIKAYIAENENAARLIEQGLEYDKWIYPYDYYKGCGMDLLSLVESRRILDFYKLKGYLALHEGRKTDALRDYLNIVETGRTLSSDQILISRLIELGFHGVGLSELIKVLSKGPMSEKDSRLVLENLLELYPQRGEWSSAMHAEKFLFYISIRNIIAKKTDGGNFRKRSSKLHILSTSKYRKDYNYLVSTYKKFVELYGNIDPAKYYALPCEMKYEDDKVVHLKIGIEPGRIYWFLVDDEFAISGITSMAKKFGRLEVYWRGAIIMAAIRLFEVKNGRLPGSLSGLAGLVPEKFFIDPFSGNKLIYKKEGVDFRFYSTHLDGKDDGGGSKCLEWRDEKDFVLHKP
jgi:hypothetical protein